MRLNRHQRGDTLVEVLVATVVLTIILAGSYTVVNRSTRINQTSIERTEVANQLAEQAELLRAMRSKAGTSGAGGQIWDDIIDEYPPPAGGIGDHDCSPPDSSSAFYLSTETATLGEPADFVRGSTAGLGVATDAYDDLFDVWIIAEDSPNDIDNNNTIDDQLAYHVRGCWEGIGGQTVQRAEIILRLRL